MKTKLLSLILALAWAVSAQAQTALWPTPTAGALQLNAVNNSVTAVVTNFPPAPSSGMWDFVIHDNVTSPGNAFANTVIPSVNFIFNPTTQVLDIAQPDWNVSSSTAAGYIKNKPSIPAAAPLTQRIRATTNSSGFYTWTFATAFASAPVVTVIAEGVAGTPINAQITTTATTTSVTVQTMSAPTTTLLGIVVLGAPAAVSAPVDIIAVAP